MKTLSNNQYAVGSLIPAPEYNENESIYDEFAEIKFEVEWMQKAWEILGTLWYHEESAAFL